MSVRTAPRSTALISRHTTPTNLAPSHPAPGGRRTTRCASPDQWAGWNNHEPAEPVPLAHSGHRRFHVKHLAPTRVFGRASAAELSVGDAGGGTCASGDRKAGPGPRTRLPTRQHRTGAHDPLSHLPLVPRRGSRPRTCGGCRMERPRVRRVVHWAYSRHTQGVSRETSVHSHSHSTPRHCGRRGWQRSEAHARRGLGCRNQAQRCHVSTSEP